MTSVTREQLELAWVRATTLDDLDSPLTMAIITEALEGSNGGADVDAVVQTLDKLKEDIENFSARIFDATINPVTR